MLGLQHRFIVDKLHNRFTGYALLLVISYTKLVFGVQCEYTRVAANGTETVMEYQCPSRYMCCDGDCCPTRTDAKFFQLWYFWMSLVFVLAICFGVGIYYYKRKQARAAVVTIHPPGGAPGIYPGSGYNDRPERLFFTTHRNPHHPGHRESLQVPPDVSLVHPPPYGIPRINARTPSPYHGNAKDLEPLQHPAYGHRVMLTPLPGTGPTRPGSHNTTFCLQTRSMLQPVQPAYNTPGQPTGDGYY